MAKRRAATGRRSLPASQPRWCNHTGCDTRVILARSDRRWVALEAADQHGLARAGCRVVVDGTAWRLGDLIEHFMTRFEIPEPKARELALDYPFHRLHRCEPDSTTPSDTDPEGEHHP